MRRARIYGAAITGLMLVLLQPVTVRAADLIEVYRDAKAHDAEYASASAAVEAGREKLPQGRALLLPTLGLTGSASRTDLDVTFKAPSTLPPDQRDFRTNTYALTLTQPLLRPQNWLQYGQAEYLVRQAEAAFGSASQDLILRSARAYFDVLAAQDTLALARAQKAAIVEQLEQAKRNFEAGNATITDTHEAQARYDLVNAQEIAAQNDVDIRLRALQRLTGKGYEVLLRLPALLVLAAPDGDIQRWIELSENQSFAVVAQRAQLEFQTLELKRNRAGHLPTLDFVASYGDTDQTGTPLTPIGSHVKTGIVGLQLNLPLYAGGGLNSRTREAAALLDKARADFDSVRRQQAQATEQNFLNVVTGIAQVGALEQALASSESALESNKLGYEVGVRINIDVLNAQQQVYATRRDLALARYRAILDQLRLKASAGALEDSDIAQVNALLQVRSADETQVTARLGRP